MSRGRRSQAVTSLSRSRGPVPPMKATLDENGRLVLSIRIRLGNGEAVEGVGSQKSQLPTSAS